MARTVRVGAAERAAAPKSVIQSRRIPLIFGEFSRNVGEVSGRTLGFTHDAELEMQLFGKLP
jgi:hypothetical protein